MGRLYAYQDKTPKVSASALLLDSAEITGDVIVGEDTIIGAGCHLEAVTVVEPAAIVCDYTRVGRESLVQAGSCVKQLDRFPARSVLDGFPAQRVGSLDGPPERPSWALSRHAVQTLARVR